MRLQLGCSTGKASYWRLVPLQVHSSSSQGYEMTLQDELSEKMGSQLLDCLLNLAWFGCDMVVTLPSFFLTNPS